MASISLKYCCFIPGFPTSSTKAGTIVRSAGSRAMLNHSLGVLNALDQIGVLLAVFLPDRLHRRLERLLVVDLDDLDAGLLHLLDRLLFHRIPELALVELRLPGGFHDQRLVLRRERAPDFLREHEDLRDHQMSGERVVLGVAEMLPGGVARIIVLGA